MKRSAIACGFVLVVVALALAAGCESSPKAAKAPAAPRAAASSNDPNLDPTAIHLHDLAGMLLLYHATNGQLPAKLADAAFDDPQQATTDPASGRAYIYTPGGTQPKGFPGRVIVYQGVPTSREGRWALLVNDKANDGKLVTYVLRVPDKLLKPAK